MVAKTNPTIRQRELGKRLRELRTMRNLTVQEVAAQLLCSATKISRLETAARKPVLRDVRDLCMLYGVDKATTDQLMELAQGAHGQVWWTQYEDIELGPYLGLEQVASAITSYSTYYVPALLQTEDYTRKIINTIAPRMDSDVLKQRVEVRMRRQEVLEDDSRPRYRVLLDEAVLYRRVGSPTVMAAQLDKAINTARSGRAVIQVIPLSAGAIAAAQDSNFVLLEFDDEQRHSPMVFVEGLTGNQYLEHKPHIARYREAVDLLRDAALSPGDSINRIDEARERFQREVTDMLCVELKMLRMLASVILLWCWSYSKGRMILCQRKEISTGVFHRRAKAAHAYRSPGRANLS
jgi:transcriptional regulator with XRE-family HTH domain